MAPPIFASVSEFLRSRLDSYLLSENHFAREQDLNEISQLIAEAILPVLAQHGAVRMKLVENPSQYSMPTLERLLLEISGAIGFLLPQSYSEEKLVHVQDDHLDYNLPETRGHQTSNALGFHSDRCDLNLLLYIRTAKMGGNLSVVSYEQAATDLRQWDLSALATLYNGYPFDLREERIFPSLKWYWRPILWEYDGNVRGHYIQRFIKDSQRHFDCPRLTERQILALDRFNLVLDRIRESTSFSPIPGELLVLDNFRVMHSRTAYTDISGFNGKRLALRTWVAPYNSEPLPLVLHPLTGSCIGGSFRGGVGRSDVYRNKLGTILPKSV